MNNNEDSTSSADDVLTKALLSEPGSRDSGHIHPYSRVPSPSHSSLGKSSCSNSNCSECGYDGDEPLSLNISKAFKQGRNDHDIVAADSDTRPFRQKAIDLIMLRDLRAFYSRLKKNFGRDLVWLMLSFYLSLKGFALALVNMNQLPFYKELMKIDNATYQTYLLVRSVSILYRICTVRGRVDL